MSLLIIVKLFTWFFKDWTSDLWLPYSTSSTNDVVTTSRLGPVLSSTSLYCTYSIPIYTWVDSTILSIIVQPTYRIVSVTFYLPLLSHLLDNPKRIFNYTPLIISSLYVFWWYLYLFLANVNCIRNIFYYKDSIIA